MGDNALIPVEQKEIEFYGDNVIAVRLEDGTVYVPVKPLCELIGVDWSGQRQRIQRDEILSEFMSGVVVTPSPLAGNKFANPQEMLALPLDMLNGWLFGINAKRVKESVRESLKRYQRECYRVLYEAFGRNEVTARPDDELMQSQSESAIAYRHALAIAKIARQQYYLEKRVDGQSEQIVWLDERVSLLEANMADPDAVITQKQAQTIAQAVKTIALYMRDQDGRNHFGRIYNELYSRYDITGYKMLPAAKYDDAIQWLRGWWSEVNQDDAVPF